MIALFALTSHAADDDYSAFPLVLASSRLNLRIDMVLDGHSVVVTDPSGGRWKLTVANRRAFPAFHETVAVQATVIEGGRAFFYIVPASGWAWTVELLPPRPWLPIRI